MKYLSAALAILALGPICAARADSGSALGESSRTAALAGSTTARTADAAAVHSNPGALGHADRPLVSLGGHVGDLRMWLARPGERPIELGQTVAGFQGALVARMPGPDWLRRLRLGLAVHIPAESALRITAPPRRDLPSAPLYGDRAGRIAATFSAGVELPWHLAVGLGVQLTPELWAPTTVSYDPSRSDDPDENVLVDLDRELRVRGAALAGVHFSPLDALAFGLAWRQAATVRAYGPNDTRAGPLVVDAEIDFHEVFAPEELAAGVMWEPIRRLSLSADLEWARWSAFRTIHNEVPDTRFHDVVNVRVGAEWTPRPPLTVRAGWAFEPSPVPPQSGLQNYADADRHVIALGLGVDLESRGWAPMRIDAHLRWHVLGRQHATKDLATLPDVDPDAPGQQIDNLGYPSFEASGTFVQAGLTVTIPLGGTAREGAP